MCPDDTNEPGRKKKNQQNAILEEIPKPEFLKILEEVTNSKLDL